MKKSLTLMAAGALALTGCDFAGSTDSSPLPVSSIQVSSLPAMTGGEPWDSDGTAPDVYVEIRNAAGRAVFRSDVQQDVEADVLTFAVDSGLEVAFSTMAMHVSVFETDGDVILAREMAETPSFTIDQLAGGDLQLSDKQDRGAQIRIVSTAQATQ